MTISSWGWAWVSICLEEAIAISGTLASLASLGLASTFWPISVETSLAYNFSKWVSGDFYSPDNWFDSLLDNVDRTKIQWQVWDIARILRSASLLIFIRSTHLLFATLTPRSSYFLPSYGSATTKGKNRRLKFCFPVVQLSDRTKLDDLDFD